MSIASEITRINTNIANSYTAVDNKNGTLPATQNSANLASAIDSIEVIESATAEGESLSLANTKAMPYSDYVVEGKSEQEGEPSPSNPSEIHSVADDVNLFDVNSIPDLYTNFTAEKNNNHLIITATGTGGAQYCTSYVKNVDNTKNYTLSFKAKKIVKGTNGGPNIRFLVYGSNDDSNYSLLYTLEQDNPVEGQEYSFNRTFTSYKYYRFYIYNNTSNPVTIGEQTDYYDIKFQEGFIATPYSPYNQGTVTIKQRGKNLAYTGWAENFVNAVNNSNQTKIETYQNKNCLYFTPIAGSGSYPTKNLTLGISFKENTQYTISCDILKLNKTHNTLAIQYTDGTSTPFTTVSATNTWEHKTITSTLNKTIAFIRPNYTDGNTYINIDTWQIEERNNSNYIRTISS